MALLRGVNVGGARKLPMAALERAFHEAGAAAAETVIQSGNVVFEAGEPGTVATAAAAIIEREFGFRPPIVVRAAAAWRAMAAANPFLAAGGSADILHVACLAAAPARELADAIDPKAIAPEAFVVSGADVYLSLPNGVARSTLTNALLDRTFVTVSTLRNWRTVLKIGARLEG